MKTLQLFLGLILSALLSTTTNAQSFGEIQGQVFDLNNEEPLAFANVFIKHASGELQGTTTDIDGRFTLKPLVAGTYSVNFTSMGYQKLIQTNVVVKPDEIALLRNVTLASGIGLPVLDVKAHVKPLIDPFETGKMTVLFKEIENSPVARNPEALLVGIAPGVSTGGTDGEIYFRGSRNGASVYFVDGVKLTNGLSSMPKSAMGSITVYTGGIPAKYGDTIGGVVSIETKSYFDLLRQYKIDQGNNGL